tara:strand:+ start:325 stop:1554 length:1230 start_codon:yes stop_codon:yes gene_type:complete
MARNRSKYTESDVKNDDKRKPVKKSRNPRTSKRIEEASAHRTGIVDQVPFILGTMAVTAIRKNNDDAYLKLFELSTASDLHYVEVLTELERIDTKFNLLAHSFELIAHTKRDIDYNAQNLQANAEILIETKRYSEHLEVHYFETILETFRALDPLLDYDYMFSSLHNLDATVELVRKINVHQNLLNNIETIIEAKRDLATNRLRSHTIEVIAEARRSLTVAVNEVHSSEVILSTDRALDVNEMEAHNNSVSLETEKWFHVCLSAPKWVAMSHGVPAHWTTLDCYVHVPPMFRSEFDDPSSLCNINFTWKVSSTGEPGTWSNVNSSDIGTKWRDGDSITGGNFGNNNIYRCKVTIQFRAPVGSGAANYDKDLHTREFRIFFALQTDLIPTIITTASDYSDSTWHEMTGWW